MAFYFALLNVSKKDDRSTTSHRKHRRHSIASVESPLHDYRLLPRTKLYKDDLVLKNDTALEEEEYLEQPSPSNKHFSRRSRGSARASKWVQENQHRKDTQKSMDPLPTTHPPQQSSHHGNGHAGNPSGSKSQHDFHHNPPSSSSMSSTVLPLSRSKRMAFTTSLSVGEIRKKEKDDGKQGKPVKTSHSSEPNRQPSRLPIRKKSPNSTSTRPSRPSWKASRNFSPPVHSNGGTVPGKGLEKEKQKQMTNNGSAQNPKPICRVHVERALNITRDVASALPQFTNNAGSATATDDSRRSSDMSIRRDDSPASSCDLNPHIDITSISNVIVPTSMKLSGISMSSRSSEPRLKKVTFECSPYVISNSFLGDRAVLVRRGSGTAVRRMPICDEPSLPTQPFTSTKVLAPHDEVCGGDWWTPCVEVVPLPKLIANGCHVVNDLTLTDNRANEAIEKLQSRPNLRRLIRRRSTSDKSRILAYRNTGFLSSSRERKDSTRMTASVDRPNYNHN